MNITQTARIPNMSHNSGLCFGEGPEVFCLDSQQTRQWSAATVRPFLSLRFRRSPTIIGGVGTGDGYEEATVISLIPASPLKVRYLPLRLRIVCYSIGPLRQ